MKRTSSPISTNLYINSSDDHLESEDDERDSSSNPRTIFPCPLCGTTFDRLDHLLKHAKRKHHLDLSNTNGRNAIDQFPTEDIDRKDPNEPMEIANSNEEQSREKMNFIHSSNKQFSS